MTGPVQSPWSDRAGDDFDPDDPSALEDPERLYGPLRATCPVAHSDRYGGFWAVTRYRDIERVMTDPDTFTSAAGIIIPRNPASGRRPPLHYDPPEQTVFRKAINPVFRKDRLRRLEPVVRRLAADMVAGLGPSAEFYGEFCSPYTAAVVCALLNIPDDLVPGIAKHMELFEDAQRRRDVATVERENLILYAACREVVTRRHVDPLVPEEDLVSALLAVRVDGRPLDTEVVAGSLRQIIVAGHGAPALVLSSTVLHLARDADLRKALLDDPHLIPPAVEEMLRLHTPNVGFARTATGSVELGGRSITAGEPVAVVLPAGNRDPAVFAHPDEVDLTRSERHLAFGHGPHVCPGSVTGRDEVVVAVGALLEVAPDLAVDGPVEFSPWPTAGPIRLPLRLRST